MMKSETEIGLRNTCEQDMEQVLALERDPENTPFIRQWSRQQHMKALSDVHYGHYIVHDHDRNILGYIILTGLDNPDKSIEFKRIVIRSKEKGTGKQAVSLIIRKAFTELGAHRVWLEVLPTNERARSVYRSCGFIKEGIHRESVKMGDDFLSLDVMSVLENEYRSGLGISKFMR